MKIKADFITNSSSAAYMFVFKGDHKIDLYKAMLDNAKALAITGEDYSKSGPPDWKPEYVTVTAIEIIKEMDHLIRNDRDPKELWIKPGIVTLDSAIEHYKKDLESAIESKERWKKEGKDYSNDDYIQLLEDRIALFNKAKEKGFTSMCEIDFGNDGAVSKDPVATVLRSNSYNMNGLDAEGLMIATEERS